MRKREHDVRQPARDARRPRPARRRRPSRSSAKLRPLLAQLRPFARDARPTSATSPHASRAPGAGNDLVELLKRRVPLREPPTRRSRPTASSGPATLPGLDHGADRADPAARRPAGPTRPTSPAGSTTSRHSGVLRRQRRRQPRAATALNALHGRQRRCLAPVPLELRQHAARRPARRSASNNRCPGSDRAHGGRRLEPLQADRGLQLRPPARSCRWAR